MFRSYWSQWWTSLLLIYLLFSLTFFLGGHLRPDLHDNIHLLAEKYGIEAAAEVAAFEVAHVDAIKKFVKEEQISCDFEQSEAFDVLFDRKYAKLLQENINGLAKAGSETASHLQVSTHEMAEEVS